MPRAPPRLKLDPEMGKAWAMIAAAERAPLPPRADPPNPQPAARSECVICLDEDAPRCAFIPCGHRCVCEACGREQTVCPICREPVERVLEVFET